MPARSLKALDAAPFYSVAKVAGLAWLAFILRLDAFISPSGTGLIYLTSASRISFGLSKNGYIPAAFERNSERVRVPVFGIVVSAVVGLLFLLPFPSWSKLVGVVTSASVMMYAGAPLSLGALRLQKPDLPRPYRLPAGHILAPLAFVLATFIVYWAGWSTYTTLMVALLIGYVLMCGVGHASPEPEPAAGRLGGGDLDLPVPDRDGDHLLLRRLRQRRDHRRRRVFKTVLVGGNNDLGLYGGLIVSAAWSLVIYYFAMARRLPAAKVDEYVREVYPPPVVEG